MNPDETTNNSDNSLDKSASKDASTQNEDVHPQIHINSQSNGSHGASTSDPIEDTSCGWLSFRPSFLQQFRTPKWALFCLCLAGGLQGFIVNGFVNVVITTIEKRYQMRSTESGLIAGGYDVASFLLLVPVSYFGGTRSKPKFVGFGVLVMVIGALVFSSPYFFAGHYQFSIEREEHVCNSNSSNSSCPLNESRRTSLSDYKYVFFFGQFLHGAGAAPLFTLGLTYLEESVPTKMTSLYMGIFYTMSLVGPGMGYMLGGQLLQTYVDWDIDAKELGLTPSSNVWVGAWWIGFLIGAAFGLFIAIPLLAFPKTLPGTNQLKKVSEMHKNLQKSKVAEKDFGRSVKDMPKSFLYLIKNPTFMFLNLAGASEGMLISALATFSPKIIEQQFSLQTSTAALIVGLISLPGAGGGTFLGGYIVKNKKCAPIIKFCIICTIIALFLTLAFVISCPNLKFAGVTSPYPYETQLRDSSDIQMESPCNSNCSCSQKDYNPICGLNNQMFFSPCHAGCETSVHFGESRAYLNCKCLRGLNYSEMISWKDKTHKLENGSYVLLDAVREKCTSDCHLLPFFLVMIFLCLVFTFLVSIPSLTATLRCVADSQKSFALGIQWIGVRVLGTIPAPLIFGSLIDMSCMLWQNSCDGSGACLVYNNRQMNRNVLSLAVTLKIISLVSFFMAWWFYKPPEDDEKKEDLKNAQVIQVQNNINSGQTTSL